LTTTMATRRWDRRRCWVRYPCPPCRTPAAPAGRRRRRPWQEVRHRPAVRWHRSNSIRGKPSAKRSRKRARRQWPRNAARSRKGVRSVERDGNKPALRLSRTARRPARRRSMKQPLFSQLPSKRCGPTSRCLLPRIRSSRPTRTKSRRRRSSSTIPFPLSDDAILEGRRYRQTVRPCLHPRTNPEESQRPARLPVSSPRCTIVSRGDPWLSHKRPCPCPCRRRAHPSRQLTRAEPTRRTTR
jgi:hypothetical protein